MDKTGSLRVSDGREGAKGKARRMSYQFRAGQVRRVLELNPVMTIYDLAAYLEMSPRQMHNICERMVREGELAVEQASHRPNMFKHLLRLP